jgi:putative nucleotidyltransferase with HDIG domain
MKHELKILALCTRKDIIVQIENELENLEIKYRLVDLYEIDDINETLSQEEMDIVAIDMTMTECSYMDLLQNIKENYPHLVRILIAEEWSKELVVQTTDLVHLIIEKRFLSETLIDTIIRAQQMRSLLKNDYLTKLINSFDELPIMQNVYIELLHLLKSPNVPLKKISDIISQEFSLTAKILQVSNMSIFTHIGRINNIQQAVVFLGTNVIRAIILYLQVFNFENQNSEELKMIRQLERHCIKVAEFARKCAVYYQCANEIQDNTFTSSLLHDIGKLIIVTKTDKWEDIERYALENNKSIVESEKAILGTTHAEIGAYLLNLWGFPQDVVNAIAFHHYPSNSKQNSLSPLSFVHISESFITGEQLDDENKILQLLDIDYLEKLGIAGDIPVLTRLFND